MDKLIMLIGFGSAGNYVLDMATKMEAFKGCSFVVVSRTPPEEAEKRLNITRVSAGLFDRYSKINYISHDLHDVEGFSQILKEYKPDMIAYTGRYLKGLKYGEYSYPNEIGYGVWLPLAVVLIEKLMRAVKISGIQTKVINTSYGDGVSPALKTLGMEPYVSAGNINHLIPRVKNAIAGLLKEKNGIDAELEDIKVLMAGSHYLNTYVSKEGSAKGSAYKMHWTYKDNTFSEITDSEIFTGCQIPTISGPERNWMIASDIVRLMELMVKRDNVEYMVHAPGPFGLIGGYPLTFLNGEMKVEESIWTIDEMEAANQNSLSYDGVEAIDQNGIHFTETARNRMKAVFGMDYPSVIKVSECETFSNELAEYIKAYKKN